MLGLSPVPMCVDKLANCIVVHTYLMLNEHSFDAIVNYCMDENFVMLLSQFQRH